MTWDGSSHISGRYKYKFTGTEYVSVTDNSSVDITGSFSLSFLIKTFPSTKLTYAILSKGHPTNPSTGSISMESINGFLRVYLHGTNGVNSLVYQTDNAILNTNKIIHIEVVWDFSNKLLTVYLNAVPTAITIVTGGNFYSAPASMTAIRTNNDNLEFGRATGKNSFVGILYDILYTSRIRTSVEISLYYDTIKYTGSYPSLGKIVFTRFITALNRYQIFDMNEDGTDQRQLFSTSVTCYYPKWSPDGNNIVFNSFDWNQYTLNSASNEFYIVNSQGGDFIRQTSSTSGGPYSGYASWTADSNLIYPTWSGGVLPRRINPFTNTFISSYSTPNPPFNTGGLGHWLDHYPGLSFFVYRCPATGNFYRVNINGSYAYVSHSILDNVSETTSYAHNIRNPRINSTGTKIGYSRRLSHTGVNSWHNIYLIDSNGSNLTQITFATSYHNYFCSFSPDNTKILFSNNSTGSYQLYIMNLDGTNVVNISNNAFTDLYAHWKA